MLSPMPADIGSLLLLVAAASVVLGTVLQRDEELCCRGDATAALENSQPEIFGDLLESRVAQF